MVPTLVDNRGEVITESLVSIQYIDQLAKEVALRRGASATTRPALMPGHAVGDAQVRVALEWVHTRYDDDEFSFLFLLLLAFIYLFPFHHFSQNTCCSLSSLCAPYYTILVRTDPR